MSINQSDFAYEAGLKRPHPGLNLFNAQLKCVFYLSQYVKSGTPQRDEKKKQLEDLMTEIVGSNSLTNINDLLRYSKSWCKGQAHQLLQKCLDISELSTEALETDTIVSQDELYLEKLQCALPLMAYCVIHKDSSSRHRDTIQEKITAVNFLMHEILKAENLHAILYLIDKFKTDNSHLFGKNLLNLFRTSDDLLQKLDEAHQIVNKSILSIHGVQESKLP